MYVRIVDGSPIRYTLRLLRRDFPDVSFPSGDNIDTAWLASNDIYPLNEGLVPTFDPFTEELVEEITGSGSNWTLNYVVTPLATEQARARSLNRGAADRQGVQDFGVIWTSGGGTDYRLPCTDQYIDRMRSYKLEANAGLRTDGKWRPYLQNQDGSETAVIVSLSGAQLSTVADLMIAHVNKCDTAEENLINKILADDFTSTFQQEFDALPP